MIRYFFKGTIQFLTAFHIGAPGSIKERVDNPVLTDVYDNPVIPGSSLKGLIRSCAERSAKTLGLKACGIFYKAEDSRLENGKHCATTFTSEEKAQLNKRLQDIEAGRATDEDEKGQDTLTCLKKSLCHACRLFGSPYHASRIKFPDPALIIESWVNRLERRDGVGIDRDSGLAVDGVKYDFQIVPAGVQYTFEADGEDLDKNDLALLGSALLEMANGSLSLGGKKSRGLGRFRLENPEVASIDLNNDQDFWLFLSGEREKFQWVQARDFFEPYIMGKLADLSKG